MGDAELANFTKYFGTKVVPSRMFCNGDYGNATQKSNFGDQGEEGSCIEESDDFMDEYGQEELEDN